MNTIKKLQQHPKGFILVIWSDTNQGQQIITSLKHLYNVFYLYNKNC